MNAKNLARTCGIFFKKRYCLPVDVLIFVWNSLFASFLKYEIVLSMFFLIFLSYFLRTKSS